MVGYARCHSLSTVLKIVFHPEYGTNAFHFSQKILVVALPNLLLWSMAIATKLFPD